MPDNTFSVGFDYNKFNETNYAAELSEKLGEKLPQAHHGRGVLCGLPTSSTTWTSRSRTRPACRCIFLAKLAREHVTVVLSGEGADDIRRVQWYADTPAMQKFKKLPRALRRAAAAAAKPLPYFKGKNFLMKCAEKPEDSSLGRRWCSRKKRQPRW